MIMPWNFMIGFSARCVCGACVVHWRTLRPNLFVMVLRGATRSLTWPLVPMVLKNLERGLAREV